MLMRKMGRDDPPPYNDVVDVYEYYDSTESCIDRITEPHVPEPVIVHIPAEPVIVHIPAEPVIVHIPAEPISYTTHRLSAVRQRRQETPRESRFLFTDISPDVVIIVIIISFIIGILVSIPICIGYTNSKMPEARRNLYNAREELANFTTRPFRTPCEYRFIGPAVECLGIGECVSTPCRGGLPFCDHITDQRITYPYTRHCCDRDQLIECEVDNTTCWRLYPSSPSLCDNGVWYQLPYGPGINQRSREPAPQPAQVADFYYLGQPYSAKTSPEDNGVRYFRSWGWFNGYGTSLTNQEYDDQGLNWDYMFHHLKENVSDRTKDSNNIDTHAVLISIGIITVFVVCVSPIILIIYQELSLR